MAIESRAITRRFAAQVLMSNIRTNPGRQDDRRKVHHGHAPMAIIGVRECGAAEAGPSFVSGRLDGRIQGQVDRHVRIVLERRVRWTRHGAVEDQLTEPRLGEPLEHPAAGCAVHPTHCAAGQRSQNERFGRIGRQQSDFVHPVPLTDSIHPACPLQHSGRIPWQLVMDDDPARALKIETLGGGVRCKQDFAAPGKFLQSPAALFD